MSRGSRRCSSAAELRQLDAAVQSAAQSLGPSHALVEQARQDLNQIRQHGERVRWEQLVEAHAEAVADAAENDDLPELRKAVRRAAASELGPGHEVVEAGKLQLERLIKAQKREKRAGEERRAVQRLKAVRGDMDGLKSEIANAERALGKSHKAVEAARKEYIQLRDQRKRGRKAEEESRWRREITAAAAAGDTAGLQAVIRAAAKVLGFGHRLLCHAKEQLLEMKKGEGHSRRERVESRHAEAIHAAIENGEIGPLREAMQQAAGALGPNHAEVEHARLLLKAWRETDDRSEHQMTVEHHQQAMLAAYQAEDITALTNALDEAAGSKLGPGHSCVLEGKRQLEHLRKQRVRSVAAEEMATAQDMLSLLDSVRTDEPLRSKSPNLTARTRSQKLKRDNDAVYIKHRDPTPKRARRAQTPGRRQLGQCLELPVRHEGKLKSVKGRAKTPKLLRSIR